MIMWHITLLQPDAIFGSKCTKNAFVAPSCIWGAAGKGRGEGKEGEGRGRKEEGGEEKGREGKWTLGTLRTDIDRRPKTKSAG